MASIDDKITGVIRHVMGSTDMEVKSEMKLIDDLGLDSIDCVEVILGVEDEFEVVIPTDTECTTVEDVSRAVCKALGPATATC